MNTVRFQPTVQTGALRFGAASSLSSLLDTLKSTAKLTGQITNQRGRSQGQFEFNGKPYNVTIGSDNTFAANSADGKISLKLAPTYPANTVPIPLSNPLRLTYTNSQNASQNQNTTDQALVAKAKDFAAHLLSLGSGGGSLDI